MADDNNINYSQDISNNLKSPLLPLIQTPQQQQQQQEDNNNNNSTRSLCLLRSILTTKTFLVVLGPLLCTLICVFVDLGSGDDRKSSRNMLAVLAWVFEWWLAEAVPMAITSMAPLFLFPVFGISSSDEVAKYYMNDIISLVLGSFILAIAVEHYNLHLRLALKVSLIYYFINFT